MLAIEHWYTQNHGNVYAAQKAKYLNDWNMI